MGYSLKYKSGNEEYIIPIHDKKNNVDLIDGTNLEIIDYLTTQFEDEKTLLYYFNGMDRLAANPTSHLYIKHNNKRAREYVPVYNNTLLKEKAIEMYNMAESGIKRSDCHLKKDDKIINFSKKIMAYVLNPETSKIISNSRQIPYIIKKELETYKYLTFKSPKTTVDMEDLKECTLKIESLLTNYKTLRGAIVFENYLIKKIKQEKKRVDIKGQLELVDLMGNADINTSSNISEIEEENKDILEAMAEEKKQKYDIKEHGFDNDEIAYYYSLGGYEAVIENVDTDIINNASRNDRMLLGIEKPKRR